MPKRLLVTGASGFLGSHICEEAHDEGYEVHALTRPQSSTEWLKYDWLHIHKAELFDKQILSSILCNVDFVIHNAGVLATTSRNERDSRITNVGLTSLLAEESIKAGIKRFVYVSSLAAGGPGKGPEARTEEDPSRPVSHYGRSKLEAERMLASLSGRLHSISLRYSMIYGPRDLNILGFFKAASGKKVPLMGFKPIFSSMIFVKDAARAAISALSADVESGSVYQITDGKCYTLDDIYDGIEQALGKQVRVVKRVRVPFWLVTLAAWWNHDVAKVRGISPDQVKQFKALYWFASPEKAIKELGWKPLVNFDDGIRLTVDWYRERGWI